MGAGTPTVGRFFSDLHPRCDPQEKGGGTLLTFFCPTSFFRVYPQDREEPIAPRDTIRDPYRVNTITDHTLTLGRAGESAAADYLTELGYSVLDRNWRQGRHGEIDLVVTKDGTVIFVEVKTRRGIGAGLACEAVTPRKLDRIRTLGAAWIADHGRARNYRFDIMGVYMREGREPIYEWLQDVGQ